MAHTTRLRDRTPATHTLATGDDIVTLLHHMRDLSDGDDPGWGIYMVVATDPVYLAGEFKRIHAADPDLRHVTSQWGPGLFDSTAAVG